MAADRGRAIMAHQSIDLSEDITTFTFTIIVSELTEIEPRVVCPFPAPSVQLTEVAVIQISKRFPYMKTIPDALFLSLIIWSLYIICRNAYLRRPIWRGQLSFLVVGVAFFLIVRNAWVSEDAFITFRHVDNFLSGAGPVYNAGERVEGFSHVLWFYLTSFFRWIGLSAKGSVILPGLLFSLLALSIYTFRFRFNQTDSKWPEINPALAILIGCSAFIDFGSSGLETALTYFLLALYAHLIAEGSLLTRPVYTGFILSLLILNRPDFAVFSALVFIIYLVGLIRGKILWGDLVKLAIFPALLVGGYQIFRMGYYATILPNPFFAKSGGGAYFSQGIKYLIDLLQGSLAILIPVAGLLALWFYRHQADGAFPRRLTIFASGLLHGFFVVRGGGDFMHGRFLLPAFILFALSGSGLFEGRSKNSSRKNLMTVAALLLLFFTSLSIRPVQQLGEKKFNHGISDERSFFYGTAPSPIQSIVRDDLIFMWKTMGRNYRHLAERTHKPFSLAQLNIGFLGYYAGRNVYIMDQLGLNDPVTARLKIKRRKRPGHEKFPPFGYSILKQVTFADTPFPLWNRLAATRYGVLWDLSRLTLSRYSFFLPAGFKQRLDEELSMYISQLNQQQIKEDADFLYFLDSFWQPHVSPDVKKPVSDFFLQHGDLIKQFSPSYKWIVENGETVNRLLARIRGKLTAGIFLDNLMYSISHPFKPRFPVQDTIVE